MSFPQKTVWTNPLLLYDWLLEVYDLWFVFQYVPFEFCGREGHVSFEYPLANQKNSKVQCSFPFWPNTTNF